MTNVIFGRLHSTTETQRVQSHKQSTLCSLRLCGFICGIAALLCLPPPKTLAHPAAREMADAANNFVSALTSDQRAKAIYEFKDDERFDWHFIPKPRKGLPLKEMTPPQRPLAHALLSSGLSHQGYARAATIMSLEQILSEIEGKAAQPNSPIRDAELYYFTIFGKPGVGIWGWRVEGHHLSLNFVCDEKDVLAITPSFFGSNPAQILEGPRKGLRVLGHEEDLGRAFVKSLTPEQQKTAVITNVAPRDIITSNSRKAKPLEPMGISGTALTDAQKDQLMAVVKEFLFRYRTEIAEDALNRLGSSSQLPTALSFAWAGEVEPGKGHYYRIQGPSFLIEYDDTQNDANHIHTVWRDLSRDFGEDVLQKHYEQVPHSK